VFVCVCVKCCVSDSVCACVHAHVCQCVRVFVCVCVFMWCAYACACAQLFAMPKHVVAGAFRGS